MLNLVLLTRFVLLGSSETNGRVEESTAQPTQLGPTSRLAAPRRAWDVQQLLGFLGDCPCPQPCVLHFAVHFPAIHGVCSVPSHVRQCAREREIPSCCQFDGA
jgi:hypothetical protein